MSSLLILIKQQPEIGFQINSLDLFENNPNE